MQCMHHVMHQNVTFDGLLQGGNKTLVASSISPPSPAGEGGTHHQLGHFMLALPVAT
jgi:hypothetical protein